MLVNLSKFKDLTILEDNGYSAKDENRPRYKKLLNLIKSKEISTIIIHKIDRLARNIIDFNNFVNLCSANNINLIDITDNINFNSAVGRGTSNIMIS
ncbi:MAG: recombinase family protein, partial [Mycoplasmatales bacterium]